jgi:hypothetical protein
MFAEGMPLLSWTSTRCSRNARRSFAGSLFVRVFERDGSALTTEPASEERESSWNVVGLMFLRDIESGRSAEIKTAISILIVP